MKQNIFLSIMTLCLFPIISTATSMSLKQKYPYTALTDDYGILNEIDLNSELDGVKLAPLFTLKSRGYIYWQCFTRDSVKVSLQDLGDSPDDDDESDIKYHGENNANLTITAYSKRGVVHQYTMYRNFPTILNEARFNQYVKLMQGEPYVCLAGAYLEKETRIAPGKKQQIHEWIFIKMKTRKGCEAYHKNGCHYS